MKISIKKSYIEYFILTAIILLDSLLLIPIGLNNTLFLIYAILNGTILTLLCLKNTYKKNLQVSILIMIFMGYFVELIIHYFKIKVFFITEYLYLIPLVIAYIKAPIRKKSIIDYIFLFYIFINIIIAIIYRNVSFFQYTRFAINILVYYLYYKVACNIQESDVNWLKSTYKYIFIISSALVIVQSYVGFHIDTRNGLFSVFGLGPSITFMMIYPLYNYSCFIKKYKNLASLVFSIVFFCIICILTESKAAIVFLFINLAIALILYKKVSIKKLIMIVLVIIMIPFSFKIMIKYNSKFSFMSDTSKIVTYFVDNERFIDTKEVYNNETLTTKIIGRGFGSSLPFYNVFYLELDKDPHNPYYVNKYMTKSFYLTSVSTIILDGGVILLIMLIIYIISKLYVYIKRVFNQENNLCIVHLGILLYSIYNLVFSNIFTNYRYLALIGLVFGLYSLKNNKKEMRMKENEKK